MRSRHRSRLPWTLLLLVVASCATAARAEVGAYLGEARDEKGALVYTENHLTRAADGVTTESVTEYRAPDGALIATLRSDYSRSVGMPTYLFEDLRRGHREGLRWQDGGYMIFHQTGSAPERTARLRSDSGGFSFQGWHYNLINHLNLLGKDNLTLNLILPSELSTYAFVVKKLASDEARVSAELSLKNWLLRHFAPKLRLEYDRWNRRLLEFQGLSNILTTSGERQEVTIRYRYDDAGALGRVPAASPAAGLAVEPRSQPASSNSAPSTLP